MGPVSSSSSSSSSTVFSCQASIALSNRSNASTSASSDMAAMAASPAALVMALASMVLGTCSGKGGRKQPTGQGQTCRHERSTQQDAACRWLACRTWWLWLARMVAMLVLGGSSDSGLYMTCRPCVESSSLMPLSRAFLTTACCTTASGLPASSSTLSDGSIFSGETAASSVILLFVRSSKRSCGKAPGSVLRNGKAVGSCGQRQPPGGSAHG